MPNGEIITSTHMALLSKPDLLIEARITHIFAGINKALLSIGNVFDRVCQNIFNENTVIILNKGSGKVMMKGKKDPLCHMPTRI